MTNTNGSGKKSSKFNISFSQIRVRNTPDEATLSDGSKIYKNKENKFWIKDLGRPVKAIDYDNQFIALDPSNKVGRWFAMCSCGSPAVIVGHQAYKHGASAGNSDDDMVAGEMLVCYWHTTYGKHADGSS